MASPLTMCDPTERLPWGPLPESTPWALLNPACSSAWASGPFLSLVVLASGCPCQRVGAPAPSRAETYPPGVTVSQAQTGGGVFATVPMVQTQRQKSEAGITGQDQAQGSRYLFTEPACSQQRDTGGNVMGQSGGKPAAGPKARPLEWGARQQRACLPREPGAPARVAKPLSDVRVWITGLLTAPGAPSPILPRPAVLRGGRQPRGHASSAPPPPPPLAGFLGTYVPQSTLSMGTHDLPPLQAPVSSTVLGTQQISFTRSLMWASTLSRERL